MDQFFLAKRGRQNIWDPRKVNKPRSKYIAFNIIPECILDPNHFQCMFVECARMWLITNRSTFI